MTPEQDMMLGSFFITLILIGMVSTLVMFFGLTPDGKNHKKSMRYFAFGIGLTSLLGSTLLILPIRGEYGDLIREVLSNTSYFFGVHCFRLGYCLRSGYSLDFIVQKNRFANRICMSGYLVNFRVMFR